MKKRNGRNMKYHTNKTVNLDGEHLENNLASLKPDITSWDERKIQLVEFSCPYANTGEKGNKLDIVFKEKKEKYRELVK